MKILKKFILVLIVEFIFIALVLGNSTLAITQNQVKKPTKIAVLYRFDDLLSELFIQKFENIEKQNEGKVEFTFYNAKDNQQIQSKDIDEILKKNSADALLVNMVDSTRAKDIASKVKEYNKPLIFLNVEPENINDIKSYSRAYLVGADEKLAGIMQGDIIVDFWQKERSAIDRNKDGKLQYIMLLGLPSQKSAIERTKYSILAIQQEGIRTQELSSVEADWNEELAIRRLEPLLLNYLDKVEIIISNNDEMAIGAVKALQKYGFNKGDKSKNIPVIGIGAIPAAQDLINKGQMAGTIEKSATEISDISYAIAMNLIDKKEPLEGTKYKFDESGVAVRIPLYKFTGKL